MTSIEYRLKCLKKFLFLLNPHGPALERWANEAVVDYLRETTAGKTITPKEWLREQLGREPTSQEIKNFYYSLGYATYCLELQKIPSESGYTAFALAEENEYYTQCQ